MSHDCPSSVNHVFRICTDRSHAQEHFCSIGEIASGNSIVNRGAFTDQSKTYTVKKEQGSFYLLSDGTTEGWVFKVSVEAKEAKVADKTFDAYLIDVLDGVTIRVQKKDSSIVTVRLLGIDTPESSQAYGFEATVNSKDC